MNELALSVTLANGRIVRWGSDEFAGQDVPTSLEFTTSIPGGFKDLQCSLLRRIDLDYPDEALFSSVRVYGPGNETAWEGRMAQFPAQHGDQFAVTPGAVGWSAHLQDDASFREIYVDRDLSAWGPPSVARQLNLVTNAYRGDGGTVTPDATTGQPALKLEAVGAWAATSKPHLCPQYVSGGIPLGAIYHAWKINANIISTDANWNWEVRLSTDDVISSYDTTGNLRAAGPGTGTVSASTSTRTFGELVLNYAFGPSGGDNFPYDLFFTVLAIYGRHGLTKQGTADATNAQGFFASDVVADIVGRAAPLLTFTTGSSGSISPTSFVIPQLAYKDPTTASDAIADVNKYHLYDWGVYDGRQFFWRPSDPGRLTWQARLSSGAKVSFEGDDANNVFNGVYVTFRDPAGQTRSVGPPGATTTDGTYAALADTSPSNPVNAYGIPRRWAHVDISQTTTVAGAVQIGTVWLLEHNQPTRRGQITLTGTATHPTQGERPVWAVRAGDYITVADRPNDVARKVIETRYDHDSRVLTASVDNTVFKLDAILERLGVGLVGVI